MAFGNFKIKIKLSNVNLEKFQQQKNWSSVSSARKGKVTITQLNLRTLSTSLIMELLEGVASLAENRLQLFSLSHALQVCEVKQLYQSIVSK